ncbi:Transposable element Tcb1 transposase [Brachionus plicatilis]|uniref:Transposable element Tcb1 transposase n=1 Tax=Brachionus plicatilis TaxID=10195 RepID=A0A3M7PBY6_BRAPC|nr:Transposable element Tcb1 transposase [Brachionus plicatilis]
MDRSLVVYSLLETKVVLENSFVPIYLFDLSNIWKKVSENFDAIYDLSFNLQKETKEEQRNCLIFLNEGPIFQTIIGKSPPKSLDLNPIEMIWNEKKEFVRKRNIQNDEETVEEILEFQRKLTPAKCQAYINHLKKNKEIIIKKKRQNLLKIYQNLQKFGHFLAKVKLEQYLFYL